MKRFALIVLVTLLLVSCSSGTQSADISVAESTEPIFYIDGELPDIGSFNTVTERFYTEYTPDFLPSDEYKEIIPYIGACKSFKTVDDEFNDALNCYAYGFCTPEGKIVMDASFDTTGIHYVTTDDGFGYYSVSRTIDPEKYEIVDEYTQTHSYIVWRDGSKCLKLEPGSYLSAVGGGILAVIQRIDNNSTNDLIIYDYNCNELARIKNAVSATSCSHGLIAITLKDSDNNWHSFFYDKNGNQKLGPYDVIRTSFSESGIAAVKMSDGYEALIDTEGNILTNIEYNAINSAEDFKSNGISYAKRTNNTDLNDVFDKNGNIIKTIVQRKNISLSVLPSGEIIYDYYDNDEKRTVFKRLSDNGEIISTEYGVVPTGYYYSDSDAFTAEKYDEKSDITSRVVMNSFGKTIAYLDDCYNMLDISHDQKYILYHSGKDNSLYDITLGEYIFDSTQKTHIYDTENQSILYTNNNPTSSAFFVGKNQDYVLLTANESNTFYNNYDVQTRSLYDLKNGKMIFEDCLLINVNDIDGKTYFNVCKENCAILYNEDLNIITRQYFE